MYSRPILYVMLITLLVYLENLIPFVHMVDVNVTYFNNGISCDGKKAKSQECENAETTAANVTAICLLIGGLLAFFCGPIFGKISDAYGRVPMLVISQLLMLIPILCVLLYEFFGVPLWLYFITNMFNNALPIQSISASYCADNIVDPIERSVAFAHVIGSLVIAVMIGPVIGAVLTTKGALLTAALIGMMTLLFTFLFVEESLKGKNKVEFNRAVLNPFKSLKILNRSEFFRNLAICVFVSGVVFEGILNTLNYYLKEKIGVTQFQLTIVVVLYGTTAALGQMIILPNLMKKISLHKILLLGLGFNCIVTPLYGIVTEFWEVCLFICIGAFGSFTFPVISSLKSNSVNESEQGVIQGAVYGVRNLGQSIGPLAFSVLFKAFSSKKHDIPYIPGFPFFFGCVLCIVALTVAFNLKMPSYAIISDENENQREKILKHVVDSSNSDSDDSHDKLNYGTDSNNNNNKV